MAKKQKSKRSRSSYNVGGPLQPGSPYTTAASTTGVAMPTSNIQEETTNPFAGLTRARTMEYVQNAGNQAMLQQQNPMFYSQGGPTKSSYTRQSKNYWAQANSKKKMAVGGAYSSINPLNPQGYSDTDYMQGQGNEMMDLSDSTQRKMKRRQIGRDIGAAAYGALEGVLDTVTFGLTDQITDAGYDALAKAGRSQTAAQRARNERWRTSGQFLGATAGAFINPAAIGSAIGTTDIENFANEESQGLQTGLKVAGKVAGMATGSTGSGKGAFDGTPFGDFSETMQGMSPYGGDGNVLQNLYGATGGQGPQMYDALGKIGEGGGKDALKLFLQLAASNPEVANKLGIIPQSPGQAQTQTQTPDSNQPTGSTSNAFGLNPSPFGRREPFQLDVPTLNMPASANMQLPFANGGYRKKMNPGGPTNPPVDLFTDTLTQSQQTQSSQGEGLFPQKAPISPGMNSMFSPGFFDTPDPRVLPATASPVITDTPPVGAYSLADPSSNISYSRGPKGVNLSIQTGADKKGNPTYSTVPISSLEHYLNSPSFFSNDPALRNAAIEQLQGGFPIEVDEKGNVRLNFTPAQRRAFIGRPEDNYEATMSSDEYLLAIMNQISNPEELAETKRKIISRKGDSPDAAVPESKVCEECDHHYWSDNKYGGSIKKFAPGGPAETDPPRNESEPIAPMEKLSVFSLKRDEDGKVVDLETGFESHDPLKFYGKWFDSPMYKKMMEGKEDNFSFPSRTYNVSYDSPYTDKKFITDLDYRRRRLDGKTPNQFSSTQEFRDYLKSRGIEDQTVTDLRKRNLSNVDFKPITEDKAVDYYGYMQPSVPTVNFDPKFNKDSQDLIKAHELSHIQDTHILDFDDLENSIVSLFPRYQSSTEWDPESTFPKRSYVSANSPLIPHADYKKIIDYSDDNFKENYKGNYRGGSKAKAEYVTNPTETRARLGTTRFEVNKLFPGLWNPFYEEMTPEVLNKLKEKVGSTPELDSEGNKNLELHNLKQLFDHYTDEQILDMFNSIAMEKNIQEYPDGVQTAAYGGSIKKFAPGGSTDPTDPPRNGLPTFDLQINSTQAVRDNTQTPVFEDPRLRAEKIAAAEQQQGLNFQNQVKEYVLANNPEATPEHIDQAIAQTIITGVLPEYIQPQARYNIYGSSGQLLGTQTFATDPKVRAAQKAYNDKYGYSPKEYSPLDLFTPMAQGYRGSQAGPAAANRGYLTNNEYNIDIPESIVAADLLLPFAPGAVGAGVKGLQAIPAATRPGLAAIGSALRAPLTIGSRTIPYITPGSIIGAGFGVKGAYNLSTDMNTGFYSNPNIPISQKIERGVITGLDLLGTPGVGNALLQTGKGVFNLGRQGLGAAQRAGFLTPNTPSLPGGLTLYSGVDPKVIRRTAERALARFGTKGEAFEPLLQLNPSETTQQAREVARAAGLNNSVVSSYLGTPNITALQQIRGGFTADELGQLAQQIERSRGASSFQGLGSVKGNANLFEDLAGFREGQFQGLTNTQKSLLSQAENAHLLGSNSELYTSSVLNRLLSSPNAADVDLARSIANSVASNPVLSKFAKETVQKNIGAMFKNLGATPEEVEALSKLAEYNIPVTQDVLNKLRIQKALQGVPGYELYVSDITYPQNISLFNPQAGTKLDYMLGFNPNSNKVGLMERAAAIASGSDAKLVPNFELITAQNPAFGGTSSGSRELIPGLFRRFGEGPSKAAKEMQSTVLGNLNSNFETLATAAEQARGADDFFMTKSLSGQSYPLATKIIGSNKLPRHVKDSKFGERVIQVQPDATANLNPLSFYRSMLGSQTGAQADLLSANESIINARKYLLENYGINMPYAMPVYGGSVKAPLLRFNIQGAPVAPTAPATAVSKTTAGRGIKTASAPAISAEEEAARRMAAEMGIETDMPMPDPMDFNFDFASGGLVSKRRNSYLNLYRR